MEDYKTRMIDEYGDLVKRYYKLKAFIETEKGQRHLEPMDRSLLREQLHYMAGYLEVLSRRLARLFCVPNYDSEAINVNDSQNVAASPAPDPKENSTTREPVKTSFKKSAASGTKGDMGAKDGEFMSVSAEDFIKWFNEHFN